MDAAPRRLRLAFLGDPNHVHTRRWMGYFLERGHEIHILVPRHDEMRDDLDPRIAVHRFEAWPSGRPRGVGSLVTMRALRRELRAIRPDVLHAQGASRYALAAWLSRFHPYAVTVWGSDVLLVPYRGRRGRVYTWLSLRAADLVTAGSRHLGEAAVKAGARRERTRYVHFGTDSERFTPGPDPVELRARLGLGGRRVVLSNRTIAPLYNQPVVVEALAALPADVVVVMTGHLAQPAEVEVVRRRAAECGVADRLRILEELPDEAMADLYRLADVVVTVPRSDGGPLTVVEALSAGRPVVASDLPSVREWLGELDPASLVPVGDARATAAAIERILNRAPSDLAAQGRRGRAAVVAHADRRHTIETMERWYRELAEWRALRGSRGGAPAGPAAAAAAGQHDER